MTGPEASVTDAGSPVATSWWPARRHTAALAVLTASLAGAAGAALGTSDGYLYGAAIYVAVTVVALFVPAGITAQVVGGQVLVGSLLLGQAGVRPLLLLPLVAGVVVTAELLGVAARLATLVERDPRDDLQRAGIATLVGAGAFGVAAMAGGLPGPSGLLAVALASGACAVLAAVLVRGGRQANP